MDIYCWRAFAANKLIRKLVRNAVSYSAIEFTKDLVLFYFSIEFKSDFCPPGYYLFELSHKNRTPSNYVFLGRDFSSAMAFLDNNYAELNRDYLDISYSLTYPFSC